MIRKIEKLYKFKYRTFAFKFFIALLIKLSRFINQNVFYLKKYDTAKESFINTGIYRMSIISYLRITTYSFTKKLKIVYIGIKQ